MDVGDKATRLHGKGAGMSHWGAGQVLTGVGGASHSPISRCEWCGATGIKVNVSGLGMR